MIFTAETQRGGAATERYIEDTRGHDIPNVTEKSRREFKKLTVSSTESAKNGLGKFNVRGKGRE
ncbi:MAG: hypothetical protein Kow0099_39540 [Candidatus Abyssubacteria bacterium]